MEAESPLSPRKSALFVANHSSFDADGIGIGIDNDAVGKVAQMVRYNTKFDPSPYMFDMLS